MVAILLSVLVIEGAIIARATYLATRVQRGDGPGTLWALIQWCGPSISWWKFGVTFTAPSDERGVWVGWGGHAPDEHWKLRDIIPFGSWGWRRRRSC